MKPVPLFSVSVFLIFGLTTLTLHFSHQSISFAITLVTSLFGGAVISVLLGRTPRRALLKRVPIPVETLLKSYFPELDPQLAEKHWRTLATILEEPPGLLLPSDRLGVELTARGPLDSSIDDLFEYIESSMAAPNEFDPRMNPTPSLDIILRRLCAASRKM